MLTILSLIGISIANIIFFSRRCLRYLFHFQQLNYSGRCFKDWLIENDVYDRKGTLIATVIALIAESIKHNDLLSLVVSIVGSLALVSLGLRQPDPRKDRESGLQDTRRAIAIYWRSLVLYSISLVSIFGCLYLFNDDDDIAAYWIVTIVFIQSSPLWLILAKTRL